MPFYRIIVFVKDRTEPIEGVRELAESNIERAWQLFEAKAKEAYKERFAAFDLIMISKRSDLYRNYLEKRNSGG